MRDVKGDVELEGWAFGRESLLWNFSAVFLSDFAGLVLVIAVDSTLCSAIHVNS
jgi:hypothetical protein